ncbi:MAG: RsmB/NOP family class I SAM-dependent RNA methyltransferase, partial [Pseudomonadota bacterium]
AQHPVITGGLAEFQDIGPQRAVAALGVTPGLRVLDFCAGGGGKSLALAALGAQVTAHDSAPSRMKDLAKRAARAQAAVRLGLEAGVPPFDLVVCDVPCSGSGAWRRAVEGKWQLTPEALAGLVELQRSIVAEAAAHLRPGGRLAYMTCSLLKAENEEQALYFSERYALQRMYQFTPLDGADGFFHAEFAAPG